jgi:hypothetical protein
VTLSAASINPVTVPYATADGTATVAGNDYTPASGTLTFNPGQTQQTITVLVNGDAVAEPNETFSVNLGSPTNAVLGTGKGTGTIEDGYIGPDPFDPNSTMATAANLGKVSSISQTDLTLDTPTNVDYFSFVAASKGTFAVSATPTQGSGTLGLSVSNASGTQLAAGQLANEAPARGKATPRWRFGLVSEFSPVTPGEREITSRRAAARAGSAPGWRFPARRRDAAAAPSRTDRSAGPAIRSGAPRSAAAPRAESSGALGAPGAFSGRKPNRRRRFRS